MPQPASTTHTSTTWGSAGAFSEHVAATPTTSVVVRRRMTDLEAHQWLRTQKQEVGCGSLGPVAKLFRAFAEELLERKLGRRDIQSAASEDKWRNSLNHGLAGQPPWTFGLR